MTGTKFLPYYIDVRCITMWCVFFLCVCENRIRTTKIKKKIMNKKK